jgi:hypothetical protein
MAVAQETIVEHQVLYWYTPEIDRPWFCLMLDGEVLHDGEKPVPDYVWLKVIRAVSTISIARTTSVNNYRESDPNRIGVERDRHIAR